MKRWLLPTLFILTVVGLAWTVELSTASRVQLSRETGNYEPSFTFTVQNGYYPSDNTIYASLPRSLLEYYSSRIHTVNNERDYAKFVTPSVVQSIADNIRNITQSTPYNDEEFANAVLMIVREITYVRSNAKYPVETMVDDFADCDGLSILAASLMKAGGLDVVLLLYKGINPTHMNLGVSLEQMPVSHPWWIVPSGIEYDNKTYWIAECTSLADWTVGDRPDLLVNDKPIVISLENCEKESPASISSSLNSKLEPSAISTNLSMVPSNTSSNERCIQVSGSTSPASVDRQVTVYINQPGYPPTHYSTRTDLFGNYTFLWNLTLPGTFDILTSWSGTSNCFGSDSETLTVFFDAKQPAIADLPTYFWSDSPGGLRSQSSSEYLSLFNQGAKEFLKSNMTGTDVVLSGEFIVLSDGEEVMPNMTTITIPAYLRRYRMPGSRQTVTVKIPEQNITIPEFEIVNSQFGFILEKTEENNYTASVKLLTDAEASHIPNSLSETNGMFMNASNIALKNEWHKAVARVSSSEAAMEVFDDSGTRLENMTKSTTSTGVGELGIIMTYTAGQVVAFKNLKVESVSQTPTPINNIPVQEESISFLYPYIRIALLLAGSVLAIVYLRGREENAKHPDQLGASSQNCCN